MKIALHTFVEQELETPALAWNSLCWYWGLSFLGMSPRYFEYMRSGEYEVDKAFFGTYNDDINQIPGYGQNMTIKQRFDRAVDYYEYCVIAGKQSSINPPWDFPPDVATLVTFRNKMEARPMDPDEAITANVEHHLEESEALKELWKVGGEIQREEQARLYQEKVKEAIKYVESEIQPRMSLTLQQLDKDTAFLTEGKIPDACVRGVVVEDMDEIMPDEKQWDKLGDTYYHCGRLVKLGIIGRYYTSGHNLERAMWNPEKIKELTSAHNLTIRSWQQLMNYRKQCDA